ncbi:type VII secretion system-associated protein [Streptomyces sp. NPDC047072]|uniref:type VII secretion system-associated protein n=1 Tax=Streptomyces sp. NPDC047072 TaxID=3154809 RepID=UPI003410807B
MTPPPGSAPAVPPVTPALRAQAARQRGGYVYAIDPFFDPGGAVPPYGIVGGWSVDRAGQLVSFTPNPKYRPSPVALEFPAPVSALEAVVQRAVTGYCDEAELLTTFYDATLLLFAEEGRDGLYTVVDDGGGRYIPAFTHPDRVPDGRHQWRQATGHYLAATGLPIRLDPGHRISLTIPAGAGGRARAGDSAGAEGAGIGRAGAGEAGREGAGAGDAGREGAGAGDAGREGAGAGDAGREGAGAGDAGREGAGAEDMRRESAGSESAGAESGRSGIAGIENAGIESAGIENAGSESAGSERAGPQDAGPEKAGPQDADSEKAAPEGAGPEGADIETAGPEGAAPETAGPEAALLGARLLDAALLDAPLLSAGLLSALARRSRTALWESAMGAEGRRAPEPAPPAGGVADIRDALVVGAESQVVRDLDRALRQLAGALAVESRALPTVHAAWLTDGELSLQLARPAPRPPAPWQPDRNDTFWRIRLADVPVHETDTAAPYPGLVSLGTHGRARLLLNLEALPGLVALTGAEADRTAVLASVAAELATSAWADRMTLTLVGLDAELAERAAPTRVRRVDDLDELLATMEAETVRRRDALATAGHDSVLTGRTGRSGDTSWEPHLVLLAAPPSEEQAARLAELAVDSGRLGIGYLAATAATTDGGLPGAFWKLDVTPDGRLLAPSLGLDLQAQLLPRERYDAVVRLFTDAVPDAGGPPPFRVDLTPSGQPAVYARLVGAYEIIGLDTSDTEHGPLLREALAMLLLHREGVHPRVLARGLWPRGVTEDVRDAFVARLRTWLGTDPDGTPRLRVDGTGRLTLAPSVVSDLDVLRTLHHEATAGSGSGDARLRERLLGDALALARGPLLADRPQGRYTWLAHDIAETRLSLLVGDVALALSAHHLEAGDPARARAALETALTTTPEDQRLKSRLAREAPGAAD